MTPRLSAIDFTPDLARLTENFTGRQWVFDEIDGWLTEREERFFILTGEPGVGKSAIAAKLIQQRQAQQDLAAYHFCIARQISTIEPDNVLFSLAAQLINFFPDYAEALVNTIKPLYLSVDVEINIGTIKDSVVQGVVIENLHTQHPKKSFDIILRQALSALPNPPKKPILILIDSLDEAVAYNEEDNLARLFSQVNDLPSWVRLVFTSRLDERRVLSHFKTLNPHHYHLDELSKKSLEDIHTYVDDRVKSTSVQGQLQKYKVASTDLVEQLTDLSKGNFLYTKVLLDDIASGGQPLDKENLAKLPKSLGDFYHTFLERRVEAEWEGKYQLIFKILTVTKAPITEDELANLVSETLLETELKQRLLVVQQFLDVTQNDWDKKTYTLFHQSLRDYLTDGEKSEVFYCSPKDGHRQIVDYYWQYQEDPRSWQECEAYGLQFLAPHLVDLAALEKPPVRGRKYIERLHELLATEVDGQNAWFVAKDNLGDTAGFLADVELAWSQADEAYDREPEKSIGLQCRYALIKTSINCLAEIPIALMIALIKHPNPYWKPAKALAYAYQIPDPQERFECLIALADQLPDLGLLKPKILEFALQSAQTIQPKSAHAQALIALVDKIPDILPEALKATQAIQNSEERTKALTALADKIPHILPEALESARSIQNSEERAKALTALADKIPHILPEALEVTQAIQEGSARVEVLIALVDKLTPDLLLKALEAVQAIQVEEYHAFAFTFNTPDPDFFSKSFKDIQSIQNQKSNYYQAIALAALAHKLPDAFPQALEAVRAIQNREDRAEALITLADKLTPDLLSEALEAVQAIQNEFSRAKALTVLADKLPSILPEALETARAIQNEVPRAKALTALADKLPNILPEALETAQAIQDRENRAEALTALADKLSNKLLPKALESAQVIGDEVARAQALTALADKLPNILPEALEAVQAIQDEFSRAEALTALADKLTPDLLIKALEAVQAIQDESSRAEALTALADKLPEVPLQALKAVQAIEIEFLRAIALVELADKLTPDLLPEALEAAQAIQDESSRAQALTALADKLTPDLLPKALKTAQAIKDTYHRALALTAMADRLPDILPEALETTQAIQDDSLHILALTALADKLPGILPQLLEALQSNFTNEFRREILTALIDNLLPKKLLPQALETLQSIHNDELCTEVLTILVNKLPQNLFPQALECVQSIQGEGYRAFVLGALENKLTPDLLSIALETAQSIQHEGYRAFALATLASESMPELLSIALELTLPVENAELRRYTLIALAGKLPSALPKALEAAQSIQDESSRAHTLIALAGKLPSALPKALEAAQSIQDESSRVHALIALAGKLPSALPKALEAAQSIQDESSRAHALTSIIFPSD